MSRIRNNVDLIVGALLLGSALWLVGARHAAQPGHAHAATQTSKLILPGQTAMVDLTYAFDERTVYWPTAQAFRWEKESWGVAAGGYWYTAARYAASEHGGTHLDSPIHFGQGKTTVDEISLERLMGPAVVLDIRDACAQDRDYQLQVEDIARWEKQHGGIPAGSIVLVHTGWGKFWPELKAYLGDDTPGETKNLHFPGISPEAAEFLVTQRGIDGVGIDTASLDHGPSREFRAHQIFGGANVYGLENVAQMDKLPPTGAMLLALPMKIKGGTGAPVRIVAFLP